MFKIESSKSGLPFAICHGRHLHSAYDPQREARKFVSTQIGDRNPDTAIVVGAGLGYIGAELRRRGVFTVQVFLSASTYSAATERGDVAWWPEGDTHREGATDSPTDTREAVRNDASLRAFLRSVLSDTDAAGLEVLSWTPCMEAFPEEAENALASVADVVRESNANLTTISAFGPRWFRNICANFRDTQAVRSSASSCRHVVIAAAGPSLEAAIPALQELYHLNAEIWAVGTALRPLAAAGIQPSLVITTDAGYYALEHLNAVRGSSEFCIAAPLSAARGVTRRGSGLLLLNQGSIIERELFENCRLPATFLPANGTVAGTALELALRVSSGHVVLVGLDLGYRDVQPHARPHSFEHYLERKESRLHPLYGMFVARALEHSSRVSDRRRTTRQLETYAGWFRRRISQLRPRVLTLGPSALELGAPHITHAELMALAKEHKLAPPGTNQTQTHAPQDSTGAWTASLTEHERTVALSSMLHALELRLERVAAVTTREEFQSLLHPQRFQASQAGSGASPDDLQLLAYLNCPGVLNCIRQTSPAAFREELSDAVETARTLLNEQKRDRAS